MNQKKFKPMYLSALIPIASIIFYLAMMIAGLADAFNLIALVVFLAATVGWGAVGAWFARTKNTFTKSVVIANAIPLLCAVVYLVLYLIAKVTVIEEEVNLTGEVIITLLDVAEIIGGLGTGLFGLLSTWLYTFGDLGFFEVWINLVYSILVFAVGYALGVSIRPNKKSVAKKAK